MSNVFDPYYQWLGIPSHEQPPDHYRLLGLARYETNADVIESAADRQMAHVRTHQSGKHGEASQRLLNEIAAARLCLLSAEKKAAYDAQLKAGEKSAKQEKPLKRAEPIADSPAAKPPARTAAGSGIGSLRQESPPTSLAPIVVIIAGGAVVLLLMLIVVGGLAWLMLGSEPEPVTMSVGGTTTTTTPRDVNVVNPPPPPPRITVEQDKPRFPDPSGPPPVVLNPNGPPKPRFPGPSGPAPDILNPGGLPDTGRPTDPPTPAPEPEPATVTDFFPPAPTDTRLAVPDESDREERREQIDELFEIGKAVRFDEKVAVARELLKTGRETKNDPAARYALLNMAREVAGDAGEVRLALEAVKEIDGQFQIDGDAVRLATVTAAAEASVPATHRDAIVVDGMKLIERLFEEDRYVEAAKLINSLQTVARKNRDPKQSAALSEQQKRGSELFRTYRDARQSIENLKADPSDTAAAAAAGKYFTFAKGDWQLGLPMLATGDDEELKKLAHQEMAAPTETDARKGLAAAWRDSAKNYNGIEADRQNARAAMWYKRIEGSLNGLAKIEVQKQIADIGELEVDGGQPYRAPPKFATRPKVSNPVGPSVSDSEGEVIDLLAAIDPSRNAIKGTWAFDRDKALTVGAEMLARLQIPVSPPAAYVLEMDATRTSGKDGLTIGIIYRGQPCHVVIDGWAGGTCGLTATSQGRSVVYARGSSKFLTNDQRSKIKCTVDADGILVECDGREVLHYQGPPRWDAWSTRWAAPSKEQLMVGAYDSAYRIHSMKLIPLGAEGAPAAVDTDGSVDLLALVDLDKNAVLGEWTKVDGALVTPRIAEPARLEIPFRPPAEYDLEIEATRNGPGNELGVVLVYQGQRCGALVDRYSQSSSDLLVGGDDGKSKAIARVRQRTVLPAGRRSKITYMVRKDSLQVLVDDKPLLTHRGPIDGHDLKMGWETPDAQALAIGAWWSEFRVHSIKLTPVGEDAGAAAPVAADGDAFDLLKLIELDKHVVQGEWEIRGTTLFTARAQYGRATIPYEPPEQYKIEIDAVQRLGTGPLVVGLVMQGRQIAVEVGQRAGRVHALSGRSVVGQTGEFLKLGRPSKIVCVVKPGEMSVICDGQSVVQFRGDITRWALPEEWKVPSEKTLFIGSSHCLFHVPSMTLTPLEE